MKKKERLDREIAKRFDVSRSFAQKQIRNELVLVNGVCVDKHKHLVDDLDAIVIKDSEKVVQKYAKVIVNVGGEKIYSLSPKRNEVHVIFENNDFIIVVKGSGVLSHYSHTKLNSPDVSKSLLKSGFNLTGGPEERKGIVHRLDEETIGLMLICKNVNSYEYFKNCFRERKIQRKYLGICEGQLDKSNITIKGRLFNDFRNRKIIVSDKGKESITHVKNICNFDENVSLNEFKLETGRTHQIRVHMQKINHPILGDKKYGKKSNTQMCLASSLLSFDFNNKEFLFKFIPSFKINKDNLSEIINEKVFEYLN